MKFGNGWKTMIKVAYDKKYNHICITGHDKATICASVSSLVFFSVNLAIDFNKFFYGEVKLVDDGQDKMEIFNNSSNEDVETVFRYLIYSLEDLSEQYPDSVYVELCDLNNLTIKQYSDTI